MGDQKRRFQMKQHKHTQMIRHLFLALVLLWGATITATGQSAAARTTKDYHPNFVFILVDDMGWTSLSSAMDDRRADSRSTYYETPHLDWIGDHGIRFTNGYAPAALCTPSRRSIQFGQTPIHTGDENFARDYNPLDHDWLTIPHLLKSIDPAYRTAHYGKWDLRAGFSPEDLGYDESDGDTGNDNGDRMTDRKTKWTQAYITKDPKRTTSITRRAVNFMQRQVRSGHPFYLQVSYYATHVDMETLPDTYQKFVRKPKGKIHDNAAWAGMQADMDKGIGDLVAMLDSLRIRDNTYVIVMADNGGVEAFPPPSGAGKLDPPSALPKLPYNYPLRGGKWVLYEGGIRVPFMVMGPGVPQHVYSHVPVMGEDILPTVAALAKDTKPLPSYLDGGNFATLFKNPESGVVVRSRKDFYFHRFEKSYEHSAILEGNYKLIIRWREHTTELYDLSKDLGEIHDLSRTMPDVTARLRKKLVDYLVANHIDTSAAPKKTPGKKKK
jgi:arylsulfatase A-like enzyme